jgi:CheY-specific phosphatase CheX
MDVRYINPFILSVQELFRTMLHMEVLTGKPSLRSSSEHSRG